MPKATPSSKPYSASARPRKSHGQDKPIFICGLDNCQWSSTDQSTVSRHKWTHLPKSVHPRCEALNRVGNRCGRRYFRLDDYKSHWKKCHKAQEWVNPQNRERFPSLWQEHCEQRDNGPIFITLSPPLQQTPGLVFSQASSMNAAPPSALLPPDVDTPTVPMRLAQAPAQMALVENSLGLFGQDLLAPTTLLSAATVPILIHPPTAYNYPAASISFPSALDYTYHSGYSPSDTTFCSRSSSASTPSVPTPPAEGVFTSGGASHGFQSRLEPFGALHPGFRPSQVDNRDWNEWLAFETPAFRTSD